MFRSVFLSLLAHRTASRQLDIHIMEAGYSQHLRDPGGKSVCVYNFFYIQQIFHIENIIYSILSLSVFSSKVEDEP